jgi:hypothetical protein
MDYTVPYPRRWQHLTVLFLHVAVFYLTHCFIAGRLTSDPLNCALRAAYNKHVFLCFTVCLYVYLNVYLPIHPATYLSCIEA